MVIERLTLEKDTWLFSKETVICLELTNESFRLANILYKIFLFFQWLLAKVILITSYLAFHHCCPSVLLALPPAPAPAIPHNHSTIAIPVQLYHLCIHPRPLLGYNLIATLCSEYQNFELRLHCIHLSF